MCRATSPRRAHVGVVRDAVAVLGWEGWPEAFGADCPAVLPGIGHYACAGGIRVHHVSRTGFPLSVVATASLGVSILAVAAHGKSRLADQAGVRPLPGLYIGSSSQGKLIEVTVGDDRRHVVYTKVQAKLMCPNGEHIRFAFTSVASVIIRSDDEWREHISATSVGRHPFSLTISGRFVSRMRARGTLSLESIHPADGGVCSSGRVSWSVRQIELPLSTRRPAVSA